MRFLLLTILLMDAIIRIGHIILSSLIEVAHVSLKDRCTSAICWYRLLLFTEGNFVDLVCLLTICGNQSYLVVPVSLRSVHARIFLLVVYLFHSLDCRC